MKVFYTFSFLFTLLFSPYLWAQETVRLSCVTNPLTTSYQITESQENFELLVYHHNGVDYLPLHSGVITPNDLPLLERRAQILKKMGSINKIPFQKKECKNENGQWRCLKKGKTQLNDLMAVDIYFSTAPKHVYDNSYSWRITETNLSLRVGKENLTMHLPYYGDDCQNLE